MMVSREAFRAPGAYLCLCDASFRRPAPTTGAARPGCRLPLKWSSMMLFLRLGIGVLELARAQLRRIDDDRLAGRLELVDVAAADPAILHEDEARLLPLAVVGEFDLADDGVEGRGVDVLADPLLVEAA